MLLYEYGAVLEKCKVVIVTEYAQSPEWHYIIRYIKSWA